MAIFCIMHIKAVKRRQNPVGICGEPCIPDDNVHINAYVKIGHFLCGAASIAVRLLFECEFFFNLKSGGAASIAVRPTFGEIRYLYPKQKCDI